MSQAMPDTENPVGMSHNLRATLQRAGGYASEQSHRFVTIEHILLALNEDPEAELMLQACTIDQGRLHADVSNYLGLLEDRLEPGEAAQPVLDAEAARIVNSAAIAAQKSRRSEVNGAIVLAAIIGDGRSPAANMLRTQGLTFKAAIEALQSAQSGASSPLPHEQTEQSDPAPPAPQAIEREPEQPAPEMPQAASEQTGRPRPTVTEDALAAARKRIEATREAARQNMPLQPSGSGHRSQDRPVAEPVREPPQPEPPRPLQTDDSLARFERRPPPPVQAPIEVADAPDRVGEHGNRNDNYGESTSPPSPLPRQGGEQRTPADGRIAPERPQPRSPRREQGYPRVVPPPVPPDGPVPVGAGPRRDHGPPPGAAPRSRSGLGGDALRRPPPPSAAPRPGQPSPAPRPGPTQPRPPSGPGAGEHHRPYDTAGSQPPPRSSLPVPVEPPAPVSNQVLPGQLVENIPRRMRNAVTEVVEIRIARADLQNLASGMAGHDTAYRHDLVITKAMSVRLRAPDGGFFIETASPETQWIENQLGVLTDEFASWRWSVTPQRAGRSRLQLIVSARTVGGDGLMAETALPDQVFEVRVYTNYGRVLSRWTTWIVAALIGGLLARFGEEAYAQINTLVRTYVLPYLGS